jgi:hypothetical protein
MKLDILVRIEGFHLLAGAETSPGWIAMTPRNLSRRARSVGKRGGARRLGCTTVIRHSVDWRGPRPADSRRALDALFNRPDCAPDPAPPEAFKASIFSMNSVSGSVTLVRCARLFSSNPTPRMS